MALQEPMSGYVVLPGTPHYDESRKLFNPVFNDYPSAIAYCESDNDVAIVLQFAKANQPAFQVRSGGHCTASFSAGPGILLDVSQIIDMRVMLANGGIVTASEAVNSDLWWAMRGGTGGNFGVLLSVCYQLRPLGGVFGWALIWPLAVAQDMTNATEALMALQSNHLGVKTDPLMNIQVSLCYQPGTSSGTPAEVQTQPYKLDQPIAYESPQVPA